VRVIKSPVAQFLVVGLVVLVAIVIGTGELSRRAATAEAIDGARAQTTLLAASVAEPAIPRGLVTRRAAAVDKFDAAVLERLLVGDVRRIKLWSADGTIVYSDRTELIGKRYPLGDDELEVLQKGGSDAEYSDLSRPENRYEKSSDGGLLEVYTQVISPEGEPLLFEAYYRASEIAARQQEIFAAFRPITLGGLLLLVVVTTPLLWMLTRRLERSSRERERLLRAAVDASEGERRRIARDLHDGVVQDLAGTSFALSALARDPATPPETAGRLNLLNDSLRDGLRSLRSLLVEIYPPDLDAEGLAAALDDLVAPAAASGVTATVEVGYLASSGEDAVALVWRTAQEAVRNALRHARCRRLEVQVLEVTGNLVLRVADDGVGFVPGAFSGNGGLGLRGLRDLIRDAGGRLHVDTGPGRGTTVRLEVKAQ
jgi:two-component system NarL family sensor kinase